MLRRLGRWLRSASSTSESLEEFTPTAVLLGLLIGCLLCFTNLYFGLQTGWISMMSLQSALIGFLFSKLLPTPLTPQEIIVVQTTAVATGTMPLAAGFVGILPALGLISEDRDGSPPIHLTWLAAVGWSCSVAFFGVFLSPPIRKQVIIEEQLAFPSGTATAQLISVLHKLPPPDTTIRHRRNYTPLNTEEDHVVSESAEERRPILERDNSDATERETVQHEGWHALTYSFLVSSAMTLAAYFFPVIFAVPLFGQYFAREWLWSFTPSLSYVGQGIIMGFPTTLSMNLGMLVGWGILSPLSKQQGWAPGPVGDMTTGARGWILWTSLAIMCADSVISLLPVIMEYAQDIYHAALGKRRENAKEDLETETPNRLVPNKWVISGLIASIVIGTLLVWMIFGHDGIKPWATVIGFIFGGLLSILGVRALGETDLNPVSGLGKISQLLFAWIQPGNIVANIIAGGVAEAGAQQAGDLMQDLKTGHLCRASPRAQFLGQLVGSSVSILVTATAYLLYTRAYPIPGPSFPAPTAYVWLSLARLLRDGELPERSGVFMLASALVFGTVSALKTYATRRQLSYAKWIPSGVAFAIGFLNTPSFSLARLVGGLIEYWYRKRHAKDGINTPFALLELRTKGLASVPSTDTRYANNSPAMLRIASLASLAIFVASLTRLASATADWEQCGGIGFTGNYTCEAGSTCVTFNDHFSQCRPGATEICPNRQKFQYYGVNEAGAEFGNNVIPGVLNTHYRWPDPYSIDFFVEKGFNTFRIPFQLERLSPPGTGLSGPFDPDYLDGLVTTVNYITQTKGAYAVIEPHNYMHYDGAQISDTVVFGTWWSSLATVFKDDPLVIFDIMNEPHTMPASQAFDLNQAAVNAIRAAGATTQLILVEGTFWSGAWSWTSWSGNGEVYGNITDPNNNVAITMHQYLDTDGSGTSPTCVSPTLGVERIIDATNWLREHNLKGFLGEMGAGSNPDCINAVKSALCHMQQSGGVWLGFLWWAAGPWWGNYFQSIEPPNGPSIAEVLPQALEPFL
ncbi:hypothetical protein ONZ45_g11223 [Pleurotus djamor]|nr:hypothetical protein ONZ45_g11223 [Pleurotus djamor]